MRQRTGAHSPHQKVEAMLGALRGCAAWMRRGGEQDPARTDRVLRCRAAREYPHGRLDGVGAGRGQVIRRGAAASRPRLWAVGRGDQPSPKTGAPAPLEGRERRLTKLVMGRPQPRDGGSKLVRQARDNFAHSPDKPSDPFRGRALAMSSPDLAAVVPGTPPRGGGGGNGGDVCASSDLCARR